MKIGKKLLIPILSIGLLMAGNSEISYAETAESMDTYYDMIEHGEILTPQYEIRDDDGDGIDDDLGIRRDKVDVDDWIKSVESQDKGSIDGAIKWDKNQKEFKIKKIDQSGKPVEGVTFKVYNTKTDAENNNKPLGSVTSDVNGDTNLLYSWKGEMEF